jgi:hypothetical protein
MTAARGRRATRWARHESQQGLQGLGGAPRRTGRSRVRTVRRGTGTGWPSGQLHRPGLATRRRPCGFVACGELAVSIGFIGSRFATGMHLACGRMERSERPATARAVRSGPNRVSLGLSRPFPSVRTSPRRSPPEERWVHMSTRAAGRSVGDMPDHVAPDDGCLLVGPLKSLGGVKSFLHGHHRRGVLLCHCTGLPEWTAAVAGFIAPRMSPCLKRVRDGRPVAVA